jgi:hypothetical protein
MNDDVDELDQARKVMVNECPNPEDRARVLDRLVTSSEYANGLAPNSWAVSLFSNGFRLNVGPVEAVVFVDGELRVNFAGTSGVAPFVGPSITKAAYKSLPQPLCSFLGTIQEYATRAEALEPAHRRFIELAATTSSGVPWKGTPYRRSHCEGLIQYARLQIEWGDADL